MSNSVIFCDFDGTITKKDTIDKFLETYASEKWLEVEKLWENGEIGSKECLERQVQCVEYLSENQLNEFIDSIEIDEYFINFLSRVRNNGIEFHIVSDGFNLFIDRILEKYGIKDISIFSNKLYLSYGELRSFFPLYKTNCKSGAGVCKCSVIKDVFAGREVIYIGDGRSDMCAAKHADILYAKGKLVSYCKENNINCIPFNNFNDILEYSIREEKFLVESGFAIR